MALRSSSWIGRPRPLPTRPSASALAILIMCWGFKTLYPFTAAHSDFSTKDWMGMASYPNSLARGQSMVEIPRVSAGSSVQVPVFWRLSRVRDTAVRRSGARSYRTSPRTGGSVSAAAPGLRRTRSSYSSSC